MVNLKLLPLETAWWALQAVIVAIWVLQAFILLIAIAVTLVLLVLIITIPAIPGWWGIIGSILGPTQSAKKALNRSQEFLEKQMKPLKEQRAKLEERMKNIDNEIQMNANQRRRLENASLWARRIAKKEKAQPTKQ